MKVILCLALLFVFSDCGSPVSDYTDDEFQNECLTESNRYREEHHANDLYPDQDAIAYAKRRCLLYSQGLIPKHEDLSDQYGENLYPSKSLNKIDNCKSAIESWYNEKKLYDHKNPRFSLATGHFAQLVWKASTGVGCARCGGEAEMRYNDEDDQLYDTYVVCNYSPKYTSEEFAQNVQDNVQEEP